jgi:hypothetical protein
MKAVYSSETSARTSKILWWESQNERDHWEDQDVGVWTILKWILDR